MTRINPKKRWLKIAIIGIPALIVFIQIVQSMSINYLKIRDRGGIEFSFKMIREDSMIFKNEVHDIVKHTTSTLEKQGYHSIHWLNDGTHVFVSNLYLPKKSNFLQEFALRESPESSLNVKAYSKEAFRGGYYFIDITRRKAKISIAYYQKGKNPKELHRVMDTLYFAGNPGYLVLTDNKTSNLNELGFLIEENNDSMETMFFNTKQGVTMVLLLPGKHGSKYKLKNLLR